jgi:hypothetical protein
MRDPSDDFVELETPQPTMDEEPESLRPKSGPCHEDAPPVML